MAHRSPTIHFRRLSRKPVQTLSWFSTHLDLRVRHLHWHLTVAAPPLSKSPRPTKTNHFDPWVLRSGRCHGLASRSNRHNLGHEDLLQQTYV